MTPQAVSTTDAPAAIGPYSQAIRAGAFLFVSGQIPLDPATGALVDGGIEAQTRRVMDNLRAIIEAAGASWRHVVRTTIYLVDLADFSAVNAIYAGYLGDPPPARVTVQVARLPRDARVEIDAIVHLGA